MTVRLMICLGCHISSVFDSRQTDHDKILLTTMETPGQLSVSIDVNPERLPSLHRQEELVPCNVTS